MTKKQRLKPEVVIFSAQLVGLTPSVNQRRHDVLVDVLNDLGVHYDTVQGVYKGVSELSVIIWLEPSIGFDETFFQNLALEQFEQELIMYRDKYKIICKIFTKI